MSSTNLSSCFPFTSKLKNKQLINRPMDLGIPDLGKNLNILYTRIISTKNCTIMMKKSIMNQYIELLLTASPDEYMSQLTYPQIRGFIKKLMNVLTEKKNKYHETVGCILADWVLRLRPKYIKIHHVDIFHEIPIAEYLHKIPNARKYFKDVFIALERHDM